MTAQGYRATPPTRPSGAGGLLVDERRKASEVVAGGLREHAVAEVEDVAGPPCREREDLPCLAGNDVEGCEHHARIQVALNGAVADPAPCFVQRKAPVDAD